MQDAKQYLSKEKMEEFQKELETLRTVRRKEVATNLEYAKKLGDLGENAEYNQAREDQAEVEDRINHLEALLKKAVVIDGNRGDVVTIGSTVKIQKEGTTEIRTYRIVGSEESDMASGKLSNVSPLGTALIGKKKGDVFSFKTPVGSVKYSLVSVE